MNTDLNNHPFSPANVAYESGAADNSERAWLKFVAECERLLGHSLDGGDDYTAKVPTGEGYSLDEAFEAWEHRKSAHAYVAMVTSRDRYQGRVD